MRNLPFVIWMIGYDVACSFNSYVHQYLLQKVYPKDVEMFGTTAVLCIWGFIGYLLYEKKEKR